MGDNSFEQSCRDDARLSEPLASGRSLPRSKRMPSKAAVIEFVEIARTWLFPQHAEADRSPDCVRQAALQNLCRALPDQIQRALSCRAGGNATATTLAPRDIVEAFVEQLPAVRRRLALDVRAAYDGDPALLSEDEAILCYPGVLAVTCYRLAHVLHVLEVPIIPRLITEHGHSLTGIDIHPGAKIGERFFIDHGTGVVIGETTVIGDGVRLYQGVTLGAKSFKKTDDGCLVKGEPRHPILEADVVVYSGASILGRIRIGRGAIIGGNVWVTRDVPTGSVVTQAKVERSEFSHGGGI